MEGKFPSKILAFVTATTHNSNSIFCWSQMFHILPSICEGFILPSEIGFFERAFWVRQKFFVAKRHFSCSEVTKLQIELETPFEFSFFFSSPSTSLLFSYKFYGLCYIYIYILGFGDQENFCHTLYAHHIQIACKDVHNFYTNIHNKRKQWQ